MPLTHNVAGTWKSPTTWLNVSGTWKSLRVWHNVSGVWKLLNDALTAAIGTTSASTTNTAANTCRFELRTDGYIWTSNLTGGGPVQRTQWKTSGAPLSEYQCRATPTSGSLTLNDAASWTSLATQANFTRSAPVSPGTNTVVFTLEIRDLYPPNTVLASTSVTLNATRDA